MPISLDNTDKKILKLMQQDSDLSNAEIAERVGLSTAPCWRRIKRLEENGIIRQKVAILDPDSLGLEIVVFATVKVTAQAQHGLEDFERRVSRFDEITECYTVSGGMDYILRIVTTDMRSYERFLRDNLLQIPNIGEVHSRFAVSKVKYTTALPLDLIKTKD
ncbi:Lrp/AsnC family transcriptional regulator [Kiloniella laminariae]|uniref:Lrp/AsnC family transcriptional regulator n=1 Tax=Kiloniella laminariae TaxID=454162 RepID=A0ABT4LNM7_9PROT|nr:Lrp/AsnC family transcriptional regulator [Kiloniella laminariae]MCZ4282495.1 Lrp/AsnC family transcriptional regulator [Kiloniella laminariae]